MLEPGTLIIAGLACWAFAGLALAAAIVTHIIETIADRRAQRHP
ncbi:hypothetical protein [Streptomyces sp. BBFR109]